MINNLGCGIENKGKLLNEIWRRETFFIFPELPKFDPETILITSIESIKSDSPVKSNLKCRESPGN
jgi:hypothetical protein